jgi:NAD(P)-dependent dehydrogenase (short-subunit alcohol dehydrogenase family)
MMAISNGLSKLTKGTEVTVNTILGGPTYSDGVASVVEYVAHSQNLSVEQIKNGIIQQTNPHSLLQRFIEPNEIASLAAYLSSPLSLATNGACLRADGGVLKQYNIKLRSWKEIKYTKWRSYFSFFQGAKCANSGTI